MSSCSGCRELKTRIANILTFLLNDIYSLEVEIMKDYLALLESSMFRPNTFCPQGQEQQTGRFSPAVD